MKTTRNKIGVVALLLFMAFITSACSKQNKQLDVDVTIGFNESVKVASENPIVIEVTNNGKEFTGEIQCIINKNSSESIVYAKEIQISQGSTKKISMMIPFFTIQKKVEVRVVNKGKQLYQKDIAVSKFIAPNQPIVAVISDQPDNYRYFNSINYNYYNQENTTDYYNQVATVENEVEVIEPVIFYFDTFDDMNQFDNFEFFNYIFLGDNKDLTVNDEIEQKLFRWIEKGNTLLLETGEDYQRLYSFLPESITNFNVEGIETVEEQILTMDMPFSHAVGSSLSLDNTSFYEEEGITLAQYTLHGQGQIINVLIDLSNGAYKNWQFKGQIYDQILMRGIGGPQSLVGLNTEDPNFIGNNLGDILNYIPNEKTSPYILISILLGIYIIFVGPILYLILKKSDKRDYMWVAIPSSAVVIIVLLYIFGFGTRYEKPIMNSVSTVDYVDGENFIHVNTRFSIFNNKSGDLAVDWNKSEAIDFATDNNGYYGNYNTSAIPEIKGKITEGNRMKYDVYNAPLWSKYDFDTSKVLPLEMNQEKAFVQFKLDGENIFVTITNKTPFDLETAYMQWGSSLIYIGELAGLETKEYQLTTSDLFYDFYTFTSDIRAKYNLNSYNYSNENIMNSNLNLLERISNSYNNGIVPQTGIDSIKLIGINTSDVGYDIKVNSSDVEKFNRNIMTIHTTVDFEEGTELTIPTNFLMPACYAGITEGALSPRYPNSNYDGNANLSIYEDSIIEFYYELPNYLDIASLNLTVYPMYLEQDYYEKNGVNGQIQPIKNVTYEIYNIITNQYDPIMTFETPFVVDIEKYVDSITGITLRIQLSDVNEDSIKYSGKMVQLPALEIKGRVK